MADINKKICVVGGGNWGQNHIRTLSEMGCLAGIVEAEPDRLKQLTYKYNCKGYANIEASMGNNDGYIIATPAQTHFELGSFLLRRGENVLIEKPLAMSAKEAKKLVDLSKKHGGKLMVGHLMLFHPAIKKIKDAIDSNKIGTLRYIYTTRLSFGVIRQNENVIWSFAPHDLSILNYLVGKSPIEVQTNSGRYVQKQIEDTAFMTLLYPDNVKAHVFVSWLHPYKEQKIVIVGDKGMISFDDASINKDIVFYHKSVEHKGQEVMKHDDGNEIIEYQKSSPLREELEYFATHLESEITIADGNNGYEIVDLLERLSNGLIER